MVMKIMKYIYKCALNSLIDGNEQETCGAIYQMSFETRPEDAL
jgi:hypothetical protein